MTYVSLMGNWRETRPSSCRMTMSSGSSGVEPFIHAVTFKVVNYLFTPEEI